MPHGAGHALFRGQAGFWSMGLGCDWVVHIFFVDAYTIEMLNKNELGFANGLRIGFYRVGMLMAGFILVLSDLISWRAAYLFAGLILFCCGAVCLMAPREQNLQTRSVRTVLAEFLILVKRPGAMAVVFLLLLSCVWLLDQTVGFSTGNPFVWPAIVIVSGLTIFSGYFISNQKGHQDASLRETLKEGPIFGALFELLQRPNVVPIIIFILIYKLADTSMGFMVKPFWVDSGFSATEIGLVSVNIGLGLSIAGGARWRLVLRSVWNL